MTKDLVKPCFKCGYRKKEFITCMSCGAPGTQTYLSEVQK